MNYKTIGVLTKEVLGEYPECYYTSQLGREIKKLNLPFIYVDAPNPVSGEIITTRAYAPEGHEVIKSYILKIIEEEKKNQNLELFKQHFNSSIPF